MQINQTDTMTMKLKHYITLLLALLLSAYTYAQSYTFDMYETSGGDFTVKIDMSAQRITVLTGGRTEFSYRFYQKRIDPSKNFVGFSFSPGKSPLMRPVEGDHYFLIRYDAIFCSQEGGAKEYYFKPRSMSSYKAAYDSMISNLSGVSASGSNRTITVNGVSFKMIYVEGGNFMMGTYGGEFPRENPPHAVKVSDFYIGMTEVTQELWEAVMGRNPSMFRGGKRPVEMVDYYDCQEFIGKLNRLTGENFRLPYEAEWEYAARGGKKSKGYTYAGSNSIGQVAWYNGNSGGHTHNVATKQANELGLYDMNGNVWEWCQDFFDEERKEPYKDKYG